jgi:hypothetical protein
MRSMIGLVADRLIGLVAPRAMAAACECFPGDWSPYCINGRLARCELSCRCNPFRCVYYEPPFAC